jgi:hypothetical protein
MSPFKTKKIPKIEKKGIEPYKTLHPAPSSVVIKDS